MTENPHTHEPQQHPLTRADRIVVASGAGAIVATPLVMVVFRAAGLA